MIMPRETSRVPTYPAAKMSLTELQVQLLSPRMDPMERQEIFWIVGLHNRYVRTEIPYHIDLFTQKERRQITLMDRKGKGARRKEDVGNMGQTESLLKREGRRRRKRVGQARNGKEKKNRDQPGQGDSEHGGPRDEMCKSIWSHPDEINQEYQNRHFPNI